ncbi:MAG: translocation/assembly module TamB domain-containing protein [Muribaculaceae bacterium]|nr:translocation/assembly module TamB domain-containing protein [Muribaculaceae bacterium]
MKILYNIYRVIRSILVTGLVTAVSLYTILYILLSISPIQDYIKGIGENELTKLLHSEVKIESISISPFNQVIINNVVVNDNNGDSILAINKIGAGISLYNLIVRQRFVVTFAEIIGLDGKLTKKDKNSPLNIQYIIDALTKKDKNKPPTRFDLTVYNVVIRKSNITYDILSEAQKKGIFDPNHISIQNLTADITIPKIKNNNFSLNIKRLALSEKSGFSLKSLALETTITENSIALNNLKIELPNSIITTENTIIRFPSLKNIARDIENISLDFKISNSYVTLDDFRCFVPALSSFKDPISITLASSGTMQKLFIPTLILTTDNERLMVSLSGNATSVNKIKDISFELPHIDIKANASELSNIMANLTKLSPKAKTIISNCGNIRMDGSLNGSHSSISFKGKLITSLGNLALHGDLINDSIMNSHRIKGRVSTENFKLGTLLNKTELLNSLALDVDIDGLKKGREISGSMKGEIKYIDFKGYRYNNIITDVEANQNKYQGSVNLNDENISLAVNGNAIIDRENSELNISAQLSNVNLAALNLSSKYPNNKLSLNLNAFFTGNSIDNANGALSIYDLSFADKDSKGININKIEIDAKSSDYPQNIKISSDFINGNIIGCYNFKDLVPSIKTILAKAVPSLFPNIDYSQNNLSNATNDFKFDFKIEPDNQILPFFKAPVTIIHPITLAGAFNAKDEKCELFIHSDYLQQKNKLIEGSSINLNIDGKNDTYSLAVQTLYPNKKGNISLALNINAINNIIDTDVSWWMDRKEAYNGKLNLSTLVSRDENKDLNATISINPTNVAFNDTAWNILPSKIDIIKDAIIVNNFEVKCDKQFIRIDGKASHNSEDNLAVELKDINLDYIFETLAISNVTFGGRATGKFSASNLFTKIPTLATPNLHVNNFSYNNSLLGNADIESHWEPSTKGIVLNADIKQANGLESKVSGAIYPTMDSLYFDFYAKKLDVRFLQPFMGAFTSKISGFASGHGVLFGDFKRINFFGDLYAEDFKMKIDYLNTEYSCTDSIHIKPNDIVINNITLHDKFGHTANLNGHILHHEFHDAIINLAVTNARNLLCYDISSDMNQKWYGTIFGNGSAFIKGEPGLMNINVNMSTANNSKFTFVLSNNQAAGDYNFITITDRNKPKEIEIDTVPEIVRLLKSAKVVNNSKPTQMNITIQLEVTPQAQMVLIMDPVGGDRIKANGSGNLRLAYNSVDDEMTMLGKYTIEKGNYNFTLQDIIIKDFSIKEASAITFNGNPLAAALDISAIYSLNANLTDLDESFALDKDLNRTSVPVHAVLNATGDMRQPAISFDLEFPTLTQDAVRKIKSIISTDDMMNRQIIYLVALNRFYTPEYMGNTTKNNEFANVASSTISSQLSNLLGQISDKWSIAPNFRTNKGDFSDVEVDVALSSQLLNNRLLLNGNFGYRDKSLNANSSNFIGDFDIEYLLTKNGNIRLKAYNHYNDQNYYVKSALTTQGVGIVFKYDFESPFDFLKPRKKTGYILTPQRQDSTLLKRIEITDTIK